jgi:hypothetical protein
MWLRSTFMSACLTASLLAGAASAATLDGDQASITFVPESLVLGPFTVGAGVDFTLGVFTFDLNAGSAGDGFDFLDNGGFFGQNTSIVLSSLNFSGGELLNGFELLSTSLQNLTWTFTDDSLTFLFSDPGWGPANGPAISGRFLTAAAVPVPASLPLLLAGLGGLALLRRKSKATV